MKIKSITHLEERELQLYNCLKKLEMNIFIEYYNYIIPIINEFYISNGYLTKYEIIGFFISHYKNIDMSVFTFINTLSVYDIII